MIEIRRREEKKMEIVIGAPPRIGTAKKNRSEHRGEFVEGKLLGVRQPRKPVLYSPAREADRRSENHAADPVGGRVVTLLIPEGYKVPNNIASGDFRILMRFVPVR
jgi:hypothetical protein